MTLYRVRFTTSREAAAPQAAIDLTADVEIAGETPLDATAKATGVLGLLYPGELWEQTGEPETIT